MLPVVVYNIDPQDYDVLLEQLQEGAADAQVEFKIELNTMEPKAAQSAVKNEKNIMLLITGIDSLAEDKERYGLKLGRLAMSQNRDNYAVFITRNRRNVEDVLCLCMRPAGVMAVPLDRRRIAAVFRQILTDFYRLDNQHIPNGKYIVCKVGGALHRLNTDEIVFVQALDKKIDICTAKQSIQVYKTMAEMADMLGEQVDYEDLKKVEVSVRLGVFYLKILLDEFGDEKTALCAVSSGKHDLQPFPCAGL